MNKSEKIKVVFVICQNDYPIEVWENKLKAEIRAKKIQRELDNERNLSEERCYMMRESFIHLKTVPLMK